MSTKYNPNYISTPTFYVIGVKTIIENSSGHVLHLKRSDKTERAHGWDFAGGAVEGGEDPADTAVREAKEETGLIIYNTHPLITHTYSKTHKDKINVIIIGYSAKTKFSKVKLTWEHEEYQWLKPRKALNLDLPDSHRKFLTAFININRK